MELVGILRLVGALVCKFLKHMEQDKQRALNTELLRIKKIKDTFLVTPPMSCVRPCGSMISVERGLRSQRSG